MILCPRNTGPSPLGAACSGTTTGVEIISNTSTRCDGDRPRFCWQGVQYYVISTLIDLSGKLLLASSSTTVWHTICMPYFLPYRCPTGAKGCLVSD
jgi:hypothetical protein